ncbi:hypothetical protein CW707_02975 [Candidatus Bathyarchaeota archaeon]|nr:MAG: hypothetical protein CW707_02975 [Candidatus Bathyarchaeota archaeon]
MRKPKIPPALVLFFLAPAIGELLSGSSPPLEFFNPLTLLFLASLYGGGAIVVRELKVRWKKDFRTVLLLGAAYGILEEGLLVKSFFDPYWMDLGILGVYGRWLEVNWVWTEMLIIYHAVFSISIPIILVELAYPERKFESWVGGKTLKFFIAVLAVDTAIGFFFLTNYFPPPLHYLMAIVAMSLFVFAAYKLPAKREQNNKKIGNARLLFAVGLAGSTIFFLLFWAGPNVISSPIVLMILGALLVFGLLKFLKRFDWKSAISDLNRLAVVSGALSFIVFLSFLQEYNARGMALVGVATIIGLFLLRKKVKARV